MYLEKFNAQKLESEEMHPLTGGAVLETVTATPTNCKSAWTRSAGKDSDVDNDGDEWATDEDRDIYVRVRRKKADRIAFP